MSSVNILATCLLLCQFSLGFNCCWTCHSWIHHVHGFNPVLPSLRSQFCSPLCMQMYEHNLGTMSISHRMGTSASNVFIHSHVGFISHFGGPHRCAPSGSPFRQSSPRWCPSRCWWAGSGPDEPPAPGRCTPAPPPRSAAQPSLALTPGHPTHSAQTRALWECRVTKRCVCVCVISRFLLHNSNR